MNETLRNTLTKLRLSGLAQSLEVRLQEAAGNSLTHLEFLELELLPLLTLYMMALSLVHHLQH